MVASLLHLPSPSSPSGSELNRLENLRRIDFVGAFFLTAAILAFCIALDIGGQRVSWTSPWLLSVLAAGLVASVAFVVSAQFAREPIFPIRLLTYKSVLTNYAVTLLGATSQMSLMTLVPIYFQATAHASTAASGAYLIPAFAGNTLGGLLAGYYIKHSRRFKPATISAPIFALACNVLVLLFWNGATSPAESLYIFPGGFAMGVTLSSTFVGLVAGLAEEDVAVAASGMYLFFNVGAIAGVSAGSAASQTAIRSFLEMQLGSYPDKTKVRSLRFVQAITWLILHRRSLNRQFPTWGISGPWRVTTYGGSSSKRTQEAFTLSTVSSPCHCAPLYQRLISSQGLGLGVQPLLLSLRSLAREVSLAILVEKSVFTGRLRAFSLSM